MPEARDAMGWRVRPHVSSAPTDQPVPAATPCVVPGCHHPGHVFVDRLAAIASPSEEPGLDVERLARAIESLAHGHCCWDAKEDAPVLAREYARLAKEPGS